MGNETWEFLEIDLAGNGPGHQLSNDFEEQGVTFKVQPTKPIRTIDVMNTGVTGLMFRAAGLVMELPFTAQWAIVKCGNMARPQLTLSAHMSKLGLVDSMIGPEVVNAVYLLEVHGDGFDSLRLDGGGGEGVWISLRIGRKVG